jgi:hypothetical protein
VEFLTEEKMAEAKQLNIEEYVKTLSNLSKDELKTVVAKVKEKRKVEEKKKESVDKKAVVLEAQKVIATIDATYPLYTPKQKQSIINIVRRHYTSIKKQTKA